MQIQNPILPGFHPDPSICFHDGYYYIVTSSFEYFPGLPMYRSSDLANWEHIGYALDRSDQLNLRECRWSHGVWAPCLRRVAGKFVIAATMVGKEEPPEKFRNFFITADTPEGTWSDPRWVDMGGIDPEIVEMPDGNIYYLRNGSDSSGSGAVGAPFDLENACVKAPLKLLWKGSGYGWPEGPHMYHVDGKYYIQIAEGGTGAGHSVTIARSDDPMGPYESCPHNPVLSNRGRNSPIQACGHADMIQYKDGSWWAVHLGIRDHNALSALGRETFIVPVTWHDGWPIFGNNGVCESTIDIPHATQAPKPLTGWIDDFSSRSAPLHWNTRRNIREEAITRGEGCLLLRPLADSIDGELDCPSWYGVRQQHHHADWNCRVTTPPAKSCCGISVWMNENWRYDLRLVREDEICSVQLWSVLGSMRAQLASIQLSANKPLDLCIRADRKGYTFIASQEGKEPQELGYCEAVCISSIVSAGFTGAFFALWADGLGTDFDECWKILSASYAVNQP